MEKQLLYKDRSASSVIATAYKTQTENIGSIIKATWLPVVLLSLVLSVMLSVTVQMGNAPGVVPSLLILVLCIASCVASAWCNGRVMSLLNEMPRKWNFRRNLMLLLNIIVVSIVIGLLVLLAYLGLSRLYGTSPALLVAERPGIVLIVYIIVLIAMLPLSFVTMCYLACPDVRFWKDFLKNYGRGTKRYGYIFLTLFISGIIISILNLIAVMPIATLLMARMSSFLGQLNGDEPGMPGYFAALLFVTSCLTIIVTYYISVFGVIVNYLMYGSIEKHQKDKETASLSISEIENNNLSSTK